jgi:hypothetical protein
MLQEIQSTHPRRYSQSGKGKSQYGSFGIVTGRPQIAGHGQTRISAYGGNWNRLSHAQKGGIKLQHPIDIGMNAVLVSNPLYFHSMDPPHATNEWLTVKPVNLTSSSILKLSSRLFSKYFKLSFACVHAKLIEQRVWILKQLIRSIELSYNASIYDTDAVRVNNSGQAMSDRDDCAMGEVCLEHLLNRSVRVRVQRSSCLVQ